jgi:hypothetical protein
MSKDKETRTLILRLKNGDTRKLTIPIDWKLTFGSVVPHAPGGHANREAGGVALRLYEGNKENLRAVFTDVISFRDEAIEIRELKTRIKRKVMQKASRHGAKDVTVEARVTEWVDPDNDTDDDDTNEYLKLTHDDEDED